MRKVTSTLYIGDATDGQRHGDDFDRVVSLAALTETTTHGHALRDGEHPYGDFVAAVESVRDGLANEETVLVHCHAGMSRSVAVTIAAYVCENDVSFEDAFESCRCGFTNPAPELIESAHRYIKDYQKPT